MGSIRRLYDKELLRHIAMKVLDDDFAGNPDMKERFLDEARITGLLDHPNIVPVHELVLDDGRGAELLHDEAGQRADADAAHRRAADAAATSSGSSRSSSRCATALAFAHSRGIIHRDLKPDNIMVGELRPGLRDGLGLRPRHRRSLEGGDGRPTPRES